MAALCLIVLAAGLTDAPSVALVAIGSIVFGVPALYFVTFAVRRVRDSAANGRDRSVS
jgi:hypothetical protein